ncbi:MAG TPA: hypothetical protein VL371_16280, partial [Gemmataceae bacterium]|nr:hypothetical protein [Gemmataceae bacterium]
MLSNNPRRKAPRLCVTRLEDRALPASSITVIFGANGSGSLDAFLFDTTPGVIAAADGGGNPGTLSVSALRAVDSTINISVTSTNGITFNDLVGTLTFQTGSGHSVTFDSGAGALLFVYAGDTLTSSGASLTLIAGTSLTACNLNSGGGDVSLTATAGGPGTLTARSIQAGGTGNISLQANGGGDGSGAITQTGTAAGQTVTIAAAGSVTVDAVQGTSVSLSTTNGSINSSGGNAIQSSGPLMLSATTGIAVNTAAASIQAGNSTSGDISIRQVASPARALTTAGTGVRNQALAGSIAISNSGDAIAVAAGAPVQTANGAITLAALDMNIAGTVDSGTARTTLANSTAGRPIDLGTNAAGSIGLTQAELNNVTTVALQIGGPTAGSIVVSAAVAAPVGWSTLTLLNGGAIAGATTSLTVPNLCITSPGPVFLTGANKIGTLAASLTGPLSFVQTTNPLVIGSVDGVAGISTSGADVTITANALDVQQAINAGAGSVTVQAFGIDISLGGADTAATLGLNDAELGRITAGVLRVGSTFSASTTVTGAITRHVGYRALSLVSGGTISQSAALSVANLAVQAAGNVSLTNAGNDVDTLAVQLTGTGSAFSYVDTNAVAVGTVDLVPGIVVNGPVTLTAGASITDGNSVAVNVSAGSLAATAATGIDLDVAVTTLTAGLTGNGPITLSQGTVAPAAVNSLNAGTGTITLDGGTFNLAKDNVIAATSSLNIDGLATLNLGGFNS